MTERPKIRLSRLRDIGWTHWDPIGLLVDGEPWEGKPFADEYDTYLLRAAYMVRMNELDKTIIDYLVEIETDHMGLNLVEGVRDRAKAVITAIRDDKELWRVHADR